MTDLKAQKRLAADILGVGKNRVKFDPEAQSEIADAITRDDVRELIEDGTIEAETLLRPPEGPRDPEGEIGRQTEREIGVAEQDPRPAPRAAGASRRGRDRPLAVPRAVRYGQRRRVRQRRGSEQTYNRNPR